MAVVHPVEGREAAGLPAGVPVVGDGTATVSYAGPEHLADGPLQGSDLLRAKGIRPSRGPDACPEKSLVRIDIPDPRDPRLIE